MLAESSVRAHSKSSRTEACSHSRFAPSALNASAALNPKNRGASDLLFPSPNAELIVPDVP
jgi:hypothetical protein